MTNIMLLVKWIALFFTLVICCMVSVRNIKRNFYPTGRSRLEIFLSAVPVGYVVMLILIPLIGEALMFGTIAALVIGSGLSYSLPRQWRYWNEPRLPKKKEDGLT
jgi:hypothetical protein